VPKVNNRSIGDHSPSGKNEYITYLRHSKSSQKFELLHFSKMCPKFRLAQYIGDHSPNVKNEYITYLRHVEN
jgi:hypothetical protein